jgi:hypothetical protein
MAQGDSARAVVQSYVTIGREASFGTYQSVTTSMAAIEALSCSFKTDIVSQKIPSLSTNRGPHRRVQLDKNVQGTLEQNLHPIESVLPMAAALGGGISTASGSGTSYIHTMISGNFDQSISSVCFNLKKAGSGQTWRYLGGRVNSMKMTANVGEPVKMSYDFVFKDSTALTEDLSGILTMTSVLPLTYVEGVYKYSGGAQYIQGFELTVNNNLKSDKDARGLGSRTLNVLPATNRDVEFKIMQRIDTTTAYDTFINATNAAVNIKFTSQNLISASASSNYYVEIDLPKVYYNSPDAELKGPGDILTAEIPFDVVVDNPNTTTGYDVKVTVKNNVASY